MPEPVFNIPVPLAERIQGHLIFLYGPERGRACYVELERMLARFHRRNPEQPALAGRFSQADSLLITYGDQVREPGRPPLQSLAEFLRQYVSGTITGVHLLPFFPYSSDDGFSVIDYEQVDPALGNWDDVAQLGKDFALMFDAVINHISAQSEWFQRFLANDPAYADYFIIVEPGTDLSQVTRPRALPLLTPAQVPSGDKLVWTTFSADQIDLNYANPEVLLRVIGLLLYYVERGASLIRLDAIAYLWKTIGTNCIHLEEAHRVVKLFRAALDAVAPHVLLVTETNVPHQENISYFGDGADEAQMVYQFPLPPLVLHTFHTGDATRLSDWVAGLSTPSATTTFFNFLASHDGVGVRPVEGILSASEMQHLVNQTLAHGGYVSHKAEADGSQTVYELNISYFDALSDPQGPEPLDLQARRFLASQAIMLGLPGVPGIYFHSLFGSRSYHAGVEQTGHYRSINREKSRRQTLERALADPSSLRHRVFYPYLHLIRTRAAHPTFHPNGSQRVLSVQPALFVLLRTAPDESESVLCVHNVSAVKQPFQVHLDSLPFRRSDQVRDLITGTVFSASQSGDLALELAPYQVLWLTEEAN